jgi:hypothetical protein
VNVDEIEPRSQFHQTSGVKRKYTGSHFWLLQSLLCAIQFHQQYYTQLYQNTELHHMLNFFVICPTLCASKIGINLLVQKLPVERCSNWCHFNYTTGTKRKCAGSHSFATFSFTNKIIPNLTRTQNYKICSTFMLYTLRCMPVSSV